MESKSKTNTLFEPFFGGDARGPFLVHAMFEGWNYTEKSGEPSAFMCELMRAENYANYSSVRCATTGQSQKPEDVHQDFTDLLVNTALFHRSVDAHTGRGRNIELLADGIAKSAFAKFSTDTNRFISFLSKEKASPSVDVEEDVVALMKEVFGIEGSGRVRKVVAEVLNKAKSLYIQWRLENNLPTDQESLKRSVNAALTQYIELLNLIAKNQVANMELRYDAPKQHTVIKDNQYASSIYRDIFLNWANLPSEVRNFYSANIAIMAHQNSNLYRTGGDRAVNREWIRLTGEEIIALKADSDTSKLRLNLMKSGTGDVLFGVNLPDAPVGVNVWYTNSNNLNECVSNTNPGFFRELYASVYESNVAQAQTVSDSRFSKVKNAISSAFNNVLGKNKEVTEEAKEKSGSSGLNVERILNNDVADTIKNVAQAVRASPIGNLAVDYAARTGKNFVDRATTGAIRGVETGALGMPLDTYLGEKAKQVTGLARRGAEQVGDLAKQGAAALASVPGRVIGGPSQTGGMYGGSVSLNIEYDINKRNFSRTSNINVSKFISNVLKREDVMRKQAVESQLAAPKAGSIDDFPFLTAFDMVYGKIWSFDSQAGMYYRTDRDGKRVYYNDEAKGDSKTCYSTYLGKGNAETCKRLIMCLIDGDVKSLHRCLDILGDSDMWDVAADDIHKVGPDMVRLVLRKFGVKGKREIDSNGVDYIVPMTYDQWLNTVVENQPEDVKNAIKRNSKLCTYIKGMISICRDNPSVINKHNPKVIERDDTPAYFRDLNMRKYKIPMSGTNSRFEWFSESLKNAIQPHIASQEQFNPIISGSLANLSFYNPYAQPQLPVMIGGSYGAVTPSLITSGTSFDNTNEQINNLAKSGSHLAFQHLFVTISRSLRDVGLQLHEQDERAINGAIEKLADYESKLARLASVLISIVKLARFYGIGLENINRDGGRIIKLSDVRSVDDIRDFVRGYVRELTKNMVQNMSIQQAAAFELTHRIAPRLIDECTGSTPKAPEAVASDNAAAGWVDI